MFFLEMCICKLSSYEGKRTRYIGALTYEIFFSDKDSKSKSEAGPEQEEEPEDEETLMMKKMMGFSKFDTTKVRKCRSVCSLCLSSMFIFPSCLLPQGKKVPGNNVFGMVKIRVPKRYRWAYLWQCSSLLLFLLF